MWSEVETVHMPASSGVLGPGPGLVRESLISADPVQGPRCWLSQKRRLSARGQCKTSGIGRLAKYILDAFSASFPGQPGMSIRGA